MKTKLRLTLFEVIDQWLVDQDDHDDRPPGLACDGLSEMMTDAASAVYDASHAGAVMQEKEDARDNSICTFNYSETES